MKFERSWFERATGTVVPKGYRLAYNKYHLATAVYYPVPINYIVRYSRDFYWETLRAFYWIGLIDMQVYDRFRWVDFYRIKVH